MLRHRLRCYLPPTRAQTRGMTQLLKCSQKSLFNTWQARAVAIDLDSSDIVLYSTPDATTVSSTVPLISLALVDRMKKDDKTVTLRFRKSSAKELVLRFEEQADRDKFCSEAHLASIDVVFADEGHWTDGACV